MRQLIALSCVCLLGAVFLGLNGCAAPDGTKEAQEARPLPKLSCIAVIPTTIPVERGGIQQNAEDKKLLEGAAYLDSVLAEALQGKEQFLLLTSSQIDGILKDPWGGRKQQLQSIGQATGCEGVLQTTLSRYRDRVGSELSADTPASVSFSMDLVGVEQGGVLWSTSFDETQKALFDDILSFKKAESRGFKWITVRALAQKGVQSRLAEMPYYKK